jgi:hypothetical protein
MVLTSLFNMISDQFTEQSLPQSASPYESVSLTTGNYFYWGGYKHTGYWSSTANTPPCENILNSPILCTTI